MQRKWQREWERLKGGHFAARSTNSGLKTLARTILPPVAAATMLLATMTMPAYANPTVGQVTSGAGSISQSGNTMNINQTTNKMSINWQSFNIASNETVNFQQPGASSIALNRVVGNNASSIYGHLNANGQVFLVNTNGVLFATGSSVNVGGIVASTLNISDSDFQNGNYNFSGSGGSVVNQGTITAANGGYVALLGGQVSNQGVIVANQGTVALGAGNATTLDFNGDGLYSLAVNEAALNAVADNQNLIQANGGQVYMTARAANTLAGSVLNNTGVIEAQSIGSTNGVITLDGGTTGSVVNSGTLDASGKAVGQTGGTVKVLGNAITLAAGTKIDVSGDSGGGTALIGGNSYGQGAEQNAAITTVANGAMINADAITSGSGGKVVVWSDDTTTFDGTISAQGGSVSGNGGSVETSGKKLTVSDNALVTTLAAQGTSGNWLLDPDGFAIGLNGDMTGTALTKALANGNVTIASTSGSGKDGDINVNDAVTWSANTLTLTATNNIYVNNTMTATGTAGLTANYGKGTNTDGTPMGIYTSQNASSGQFAGTINFTGTGGVTLNGTTYTVITAATTSTTNGVTTYGLDYVKDNLAGNYVLGSNISLRTSGTTVNWSGAIGSTDTPFAGNLNGFGHSIGGTLSGTGLFNTIGSGATVSNLAVGCSVKQATDTSVILSAVGALVNYNKGNIINTYTSNGAQIQNNTNSLYVGGLVGVNSGLIAQSFVYSSAIYGNYVAGGLVGLNEASGVIRDSSATVGMLVSTTSDSSTYASTVTYVGGLVGVNEGTVELSYATPSSLCLKDTISTAGGLVGKNTGTIDQCYVTGFSSGTNPNLAGFVWENTGTITNSYTTMLNYSSNGVNANEPKAQSWTAGFVYKNSGTISNAYTTEYSGKNTTGSLYGFAYDNTGTIKNAYWYANTASGFVAPTDTTSGVTQFTDTTAADGTITTTAATKAATFSSYAGFDSSVWDASVSGYPILGNIMVFIQTNTSSPATMPSYGDVSDDVTTLSLLSRGLQGGDSVSSYVYDPVTGTFSNQFQVTTDNGYVDAGTQTAASVLTSSVYKNIKGTVTVNQKALTVSGVVADKTYNGASDTTATINTNVANNGLVGLVGNQTLNISYSGAAFTDGNAGTGKTVTLTYSNLADGTNGGKASNYTIANTTTTGTMTTTKTTGNILPKTISATFTGEDKVYDGTTDASVIYTGLTGVLTGDTVSLGTGYTADFSDSNAGTGKTVTVSGLSLDNSNYTISTSTTTASITKLPLQLVGIKSSDDGDVTVSATNLVATNLIGEDTVTLGGSVKIASTTAGVQSINNVSGLTVSNSNYTVVGSVGNVVVGSASLVLDHVVGGDTTATIATSGNTTTITQNVDKAVIDWLRFNITANETVTFDQPSTTSIVLNRVTGSEASVIAGKLTANGRVFLINTNGVLFAAGSSVNVGALVASTLNLSDSNFANDNYVFTAGRDSGSVIAKGDIVIVDGGFLALVGNGVTNSGTVSVPGGKALLVSADSLTLNLNTANSDLSSYAIAGLDGATSVGGVVNVAATSGNGGLLEMAGNTVTLTSDFQLGTGNNGTWSWSLPSISIGSGGTFTSSFVKNNLLLRNLSLNALGSDLTVNDAVNWSTDTTLSLSAKNNININNAITATGTNAGLAMNYGGDYNILTPATYSGAVLNSKGLPVAQEDTSGGVYGSITLSGANASLKINGNSYTLIHSMSQLDSIDPSNGVTGMSYNPITGAYDTPTNSSKSGYIQSYKSNSSWVNGVLCYYNPATGAYDIPQTQVINDVTCYYNLDTKSYDGTSAYSGNIKRYYYDTTNGTYDIACYNVSSGKYYDLSTGTYQLTSLYKGSKYYYDLTTGKYDQTDYDTSSGKYYDPATGVYTSTYSVYVSTVYYFNPTTGSYDITSPYTITGYYALANDLDASGTTYTTALINNLTGTFTGLGHTISNLTISNITPSSSYYLSLIGQANAGSTIRDIGVVNATMTATSSDSYRLGAAVLAAKITGTTVSNAYSTGAINVSGGGLIQSATNSVISDSFSDVSLAGGGGLIASTSNSSVLRCHAIGSGALSGGLIGSAGGTYIANSYAIGDYALNGDTIIVNTDGTFTNADVGGVNLFPVGGLVGSYSTATGYNNSIVNSFAIENVATGWMNAGGLVGYISGGDVMTIDNCYAQGDVHATLNTDYASYTAVGGLIGLVEMSGTTGQFKISNSHFAGTVEADGSKITYAGGLIGCLVHGDKSPNSSITNCYADVDLTARGTMYAGGLGGWLYATDISKSYATGTVKGGQRVGGLVGAMGYGMYYDSSLKKWVIPTSTISDSYFNGSVTGAYTTSLVGAVAGTAGYTTFSNVYWNSDSNVMPVGSGLRKASQLVDGSQGITSAEFENGDINYYRDGTIGEVHAARAARQAAEETAQQVAAPQRAAVQQADTQAGIGSQDRQTKGDALQNLVDLLNPANLWQSSVDDHNASTNSGSYSAHIKSIELNGVEYQLEDTDSKDEK